MKDDLDGLGTSVASKLPPIGRNACFAILAGFFVMGLLLVFAVCYSAKGAQGEISNPEAAARIISSPSYVFVSNNSLSCPSLK